MDTPANDGTNGDAEARNAPSVGQIAHDLNNVLTSILGYAEIIAEDAAKSRVDVRDAQQLLAATREAVVLAKALRAFARPPAMPDEPG